MLQYNFWDTVLVVLHKQLLQTFLGDLQVWDVHSRKAKCDLPGHADEVYTVDWSPDGASIASGGKDQVLKLWRH